MTTKTAELDNPVVDKATGADRFDVDWTTIDWPSFHKKFPKVSRASFYNYVGENKPIAPDECHVEVVSPTDILSSDLSEEQQRICSRIAAGESESHACEGEGIAISKHVFWMDSSPAYEKVVKKCLLFAEKRTKDQLVTSILGWKSRAWQASAWYLERKYPAEFAKPGDGQGRATVNIGIQLNVSRKSKGKVDISEKVKVT